MVCSTCGATVEREDCNRNRFADYICRNCQNAGIGSSWRRHTRHVTRKTVRKALRAVLKVGLITLLTGMMVYFVVHIEF
jgi:endogenous inhibitor of DNA gyrase (YacG/DUF329 family)